MLIDGDFFEMISDLSFGDPYTKLINPTTEFILNNTLYLEIVYIEKFSTKYYIYIYL